MKQHRFALILFSAISITLWALPIFAFSQNNRESNRIRPPATPLVACDPYFSIWSQGDNLASTNTTHWTGHSNRLTGNATIDGKPFRWLGNEPQSTPSLTQKSVVVNPTQTIILLENTAIELTVTWTTPALPESIDLLSWPITYVTFDAKSRDGKAHQVSIDIEPSSELVVNDSNQTVTWSQPAIEGLSTISVGSNAQSILGRAGDDLRIDWGYFYLAVPNAAKPTWSTHRLQLDLGSVGNEKTTRWLILAYDDLYSIQYMKQDLRPFWRRNGWEASDLLQAAAKQYPELMKRCKAFDDELISDLRAAGGEKYAQLGSLCYRQCFAAGKFVADANGQPLQFCKENHSNGCIATSDVFYPMAPQFLLFGPSVAKSFLVPFMNYAASERWKFPFAPHDLGTYPLANGQVYGGGERTVDNQMPVEESGNLLILMAAVAQMEGTPEFANQYWPQLELWANYLKEKGFDPENQLCTDDFAGHLAHNVNLSVKAICALGAYAKLCEMRGEKEKSKEFFAIARSFAERWVKEADAGDHYRLAFDKKDSWSQKYNLIWDRILGLNLFPASVAEKEMAFYRKTQNRYGLALDNRQEYTKLDWITWTATLTQKRDDFEALIDPIITFINETPDRSPLTDWYQTKSGHKVGFTARPVVGGVFAQMLYDSKTWSKWAKRDQTKASKWAPMPKLPIVTEVVEIAPTKSSQWHYTIEAPNAQWKEANFDPKDWKTGESGFGTDTTPGAKVRTNWSQSDIWMVRDVELANVDIAKLHWFIHHDEDVEIYVNGELVEKFGGYTVQYETRKLSKASLSTLKLGKNRIAVHCHQTGGGQYIDVGMATIEKAP